MTINNCLSANIHYSSSKNKFEKQKVVSFGSSKPPVFAVKKSSFLQNVLPVFAFAASVITTMGYLFGSGGLFYDSYKENGSSVKKMLFSKKPKAPSSEGVKTITPTTKIGKFGLNSAKVAITASSTAGVACGLGEGIPMMALGEATNITAGGIIETPIGTGIFGIGIASVFSGLALDNTPELKLNQFRLMAENKFSQKAKMVINNMKGTIKEIGSSVADMGKNILNPKFLKENILSGTPKTIVFRESINKDGKVIIDRALRHNRNYLMHAASFTLALGGAGVILFSVLKNNPKKQKASLHVEEGGFLFDNLGMTRYGLDKFTTGSKSAGSSFAVGGVINAVSQFVGLDDKNGRALQWLGVALVFLGFSVDRGKTLKKTLANSKYRSELTDVVREWKFDLSKITDTPEQLKKLLKELKNNAPVTNEKFNRLEQAFTSSAKDEFKGEEEIRAVVAKSLGKEVADSFTPKKIADFEETKRVLGVCTEKIFGSLDPKPVK